MTQQLEQPKPVKIDMTQRMIWDFKRKIIAENKMKTDKGFKNYIEGLRNGPTVRRIQTVEGLLHMAYDHINDNDSRNAMYKIATAELLLVESDKIQVRTKALTLATIHYQEKEYSAAMTYALEAEYVEDKTKRSRAINRDTDRIIKETQRLLTMTPKEEEQLKNLVKAQENEEKKCDSCIKGKKKPKKSKKSNKKNKKYKK